VGSSPRLSSLVVARRDEDHPYAHPASQTGRYWRITPTGSGYTAGLTLPQDGLMAPYVSKYLGPNWDWGRDAFDTTSVSRSGNTVFSDWAVKACHGADAGRDAVLRFVDTAGGLQLPLAPVPPVQAEGALDSRPFLGVGMVGMESTGRVKAGHRGSIAAVLGREL
jgi:hypothetical protein